MIAKKLYLKNFKSYGTNAGNPIEIDFTDYDKLAIVGNNGSGKSTLIDAITFALFGKAVATENKEVGSKELINDKAKDAYVKFVFEKDDIEYEVERTLRKSSGGIANLIIDGSPSGQNGIKAVTDAVTRILGMDYDTFISSTVIRQDEMGNLTSKKPAERKKTLVNIFGLNIYENFSEKAKEKMSNTRHNMEINDAIIREKNVLLQSEPSVKADMKTKRKEQRKLSLSKSKIDNKITAIIIKKNEYQEKNVEFEKAKTNFEGKQGELDREKQTLGEIELDLRKAKDAERKLKGLQPKLKEYQLKDKELEGLRKIKEDYEAAAHDQKVAQTAIVAENNKINSDISKINRELKKRNSQKNSKLIELNEIKKFSKTSKTVIEWIENEITQLSRQQKEKLQLVAARKQQITTAKSQLKEIEDNQTKIQKQKKNECPVCKQPLKRMTRTQLLRHFSNEISKQTKLLNGYQKSHTVLVSALSNLDIKLGKKVERSKELQKLRTKIGKITELEKGIGEIKKEMDSKSSERTELQRKLDKNEYSMRERKKVNEAVKIISELNFDQIRFKKVQSYVVKNKGVEELTARLETNAQRLPSLQTKLGEQKTKIVNLNNDLKQLRIKLAVLEPLAAKYQKFETERDEKEKDKNQMIQELTACETQISGCEKRLVEILETKSKIKDLQKEIDRQSIEIQAYKKLHEEIFGKDGIPTEILKVIIPEIESESSEILSKTSNGKFFTSIDFSSKDEIEIKAHDMNGEHPVFRFSGGERMRINLALRLGISEVIAQRKGTRSKLETLIIDEGFGQLDTEGRKAVVEVVNSLMDRFKKIFLISHVEDMKDAFDTKLLVENVDGNSKVRFVS